MIEIQVLNKKTKNYPNWMVDEYIIVPPKELTLFEHWISADPGTVNMGLAELYSVDEKDVSIIWQIKVERQDKAIERMVLANHIMNECFGVGLFCKPKGLIIEGASFGNNFRQVELAEQRAIIAWWGISKTYNVELIPPTTIRKKVFGSGKIKAHEAWQLAGIPKNKQPNDALAALSCAYYGMMTE